SEKAPLLQKAQKWATPAEAAPPAISKAEPRAQELRTEKIRTLRKKRRTAHPNSSPLKAGLPVPSAFPTPPCWLSRRSARPAPTPLGHHGIIRNSSHQMSKTPLIGSLTPRSHLSLVLDEELP